MSPIDPKSYDDLIKNSEPETPAAGGSPTSGTRQKFVQIRPDQWTDLDALARELMDSRTLRGERITSNTLIRIAIDALLAQRGHLVGNNEAELRSAYFRALGLQEFKSQ